MSQRAQRLLEAARKPLPEGTYSVGAGLLIAGLSAYAFQILSFRALTKVDYTALNALWVVVFVVAPGMFLPLEQEVGRALADRRARGIGGAPVVRRAAALGTLLTSGLLVVVFAASPLLVDELFKSQWGLVFCLAIALVTFAFQHLTRGTLSGNGRFGSYGYLIGIEGVLRVVPTVALWAAGVDQPVWYGLCLAVPPMLSSLLALRAEHDLMQPGPEAPWSELSTHLGFLLAGSVLAQALGYAPFLGALLLATASEEDQVADFIVGLFLARIPILLYQAVQAALLPKLAGLAGAGRHDDFRSGLRKLLGVIVAIGVVGIIAGYTVGPEVGKILFGDKFVLEGSDLALLVTGSTLFILALTLAQALIALLGHAQAALAWVVGIAAFIVVTALGNDLFLRVELGFVAGAIAAAVIMAAFLAQRMRVAVPESATTFVELIEHEPLEI
jgi:O-antigen/teichoic acid export membrane protein